MRLLLLFTLTLMLSSLTARDFEIKSPNSTIMVKISTEGKTSMTVTFNGINLFEIEELGMQIDERYLGRDRIRSHKIDASAGTVSSVVPYKRKEIDYVFNRLTIMYAGKYSLIVRVYDDGVAYRFVDEKRSGEQVIKEDLSLSFPESTVSYFPQEESMYSHNERTYLVKDVDEFEEGAFCSLPVMFKSAAGSVLLTEASMHQYPCMFLEKEGTGFKSTFPNYVLEAIPNEESSPDRNQTIVREADYIAQIDGARSYPWRVFMIGDDATFIESDLITLLSNTSKIADPSWIKPGKVAWDWYNANILHGVDFESGINQETYKYYIDFASENEIEYVILDEGWTKSTTEIMEDNDEMDVPGLIRYAKSKNVEIILWVLWKPLDENLDAILELYQSWGAAGVKVDFMQRSDQYVVESYERIAKKAAALRMLVDYHGAFKPAGIERVWPNIISYEGVKGNEHNKWSADINPEHNLTIPFIRMAAGPIDFTPGSMINTNEENFTIRFNRPMSLGSRAHQVAMYVVYESPLQMMCESPSIYKKEQETVDFITQIPTVWDETVVLEAAVADYLVVARRSGGDWYIGAMTDWTARDFSIELSFLGAGQYQLQSMKDGPNTTKYAADYQTETKNVTSSTTLDMKLAPGGGWAGILKAL